MSRRKTVILKNAVDKDTSDKLYKRMVNLPWKGGVRSRSGFTRLAHSLDLDSSFGEEIMGLITEILHNMKRIDSTIPNYAILGVYINYYRNGQMYTPNHSHKGTHQLVVSFGATRTLTIGKKSIRMEKGDSVLFGSASHGVPLEECDEGRISIATFMVPM